MFSFIYITVPSAEEAQKIARTLLEERLVACANIMPAHKALYWWDGKIEEGQEVALILKTRAANTARIEARVKALHSYDCPCIVALPIERGYQPFLDWIERETQV